MKQFSLKWRNNWTGSEFVSNYDFDGRFAQKGHTLQTWMRYIISIYHPKDYTFLGVV